MPAGYYHLRTGDLTFDSTNPPLLNGFPIPMGRTTPSSPVVGDLDGYVHWLNLADGAFAARMRAGHDAEAGDFVGRLLGDVLVAAAYAGRGAVGVGGDRAVVDVVGGADTGPSVPEDGVDLIAVVLGVVLNNDAEVRNEGSELLDLNV